MALVVEQPIATFDLSEIARGDLVYGKHRTWPEGKAGFVTSATEKELIVQYHPGIGNVTNHFRICLLYTSGSGIQQILELQEFVCN